MPKRSIRTRFLAERNSRSVDFCSDSSRKIQQQLVQSELFLRASTVALYSPIRNEVHTSLVAEKALEGNKTLLYPRVRDEELEFLEVTELSDLAPGAFGVLEPCQGRVLPVAQIELIVVPGVVFDQRGHRLGYGRGFYDRTLSCCGENCSKVGFAYDFQLVKDLPSAEHDEKLSVLITEGRMMTIPT